MMWILGEATINEGDFPAIEAKMLELVAKKEEIKNVQDISKADALKMFGDRGEEYKTELISDWDDGKITSYTPGGVYRPVPLVRTCRTLLYLKGC